MLAPSHSTRLTCKLDYSVRSESLPLDTELQGYMHVHISPSLTTGSDSGSGVGVAKIFLLITIKGRVSNMKNQLSLFHSNELPMHSTSENR